MRVLFVVFPEPGHLNAMHGVAQHLASASHHLEFFSMDDLTPRLAKAGLSVRCATLRKLLVDGPHRRRAAEIGRSHAAANGALRVAELVVELGQTRRPVLPG